MHRTAPSCITRRPVLFDRSMPPLPSELRSTPTVSNRYCLFVCVCVCMCLCKRLRTWTYPVMLCLSSLAETCGSVPGLCPYILWGFDYNFKHYIFIKQTWLLFKDISCQRGEIQGRFWNSLFFEHVLGGICQNPHINTDACWGVGDVRLSILPQLLAHWLLTVTMHVHHQEIPRITVRGHSLDIPRFEESLNN